MSIPLPPIDEMRQMRFSAEFWLMFANTMNELFDANILESISDIDEATADLFFTTVASRMIDEAGADNMPSLDDTIIMVKVILREELTEALAQEAIHQLFKKMGDKK